MSHGGLQDFLTPSPPQHRQMLTRTFFQDPLPTRTLRCPAEVPLSGSGAEARSTPLLAELEVAIGFMAQDLQPLLSEFQVSEACSVASSLPLPLQAHSQTVICSSRPGGPIHANDAMRVALVSCQHAFFEASRQQERLIEGVLCQARRVATAEREVAMARESCRALRARLASQAAAARGHSTSSEHTRPVSPGLSGESGVTAAFCPKIPLGASCTPYAGAEIPRHLKVVSPEDAAAPDATMFHSASLIWQAGAAQSHRRSTSESRGLSSADRNSVEGIVGIAPEILDEPRQVYLQELREQRCIAAVCLDSLNRSIRPKFFLTDYPSQSSIYMCVSLPPLLMRRLF